MIPTSLDSLLRAFNSDRPDGDAYDLLPGFLRGPSSEIERFVDGVLASLPKGGIFLDAALSHVSEDALDRLVQTWVASLDDDGMSESVESLIAYVSLQRPTSLHPFLSRLFTLCPNRDSYYENWPWRDAPASVLDFLADQSNRGTTSAIQLKAFECLLETRLPGAFEICASLAKSIPTPHPIEVYLQEVGFSEGGNALYQTDMAHLIFPDDHFAPPSSSWSLQGLHPTWRLEEGDDSYRFGGESSCSCGLCGNRLHRLMEVPENRLGISDKSRLFSLQTCLSCLGWEEPVLYYYHEESGNVVSLNEGTRTPEFPVGPLKQCQVKLAPTPARWRWQDWALSNSRENLHRIGGFPTWVQSADHPPCPVCKRTMTFMMQLDSELPTADEGEWLWGSGGICYGFRCAPCRTTAYLWQCT